MEDYYNLLGVSDKASDEEIKKEILLWEECRDFLEWGVFLEWEAI